jgi:hypothetical protein
MLHITDEAEAFTILESFNAADFDFSVQHARFLRSPQHVVFFLFCPAGKSKGARVFVFDNPPIAGEIESDLLNEILKLSGDPPADSLREHASDVIRNFVETKQAGHYFFDAH